MPNVKVQITKDWGISENWVIGDLIAYLTNFAEQVPPEYRAKAMVAIESEYDSSSVELEVFYMRPQTKAEAAAERDQRAQDAKRYEANERETLARLKAKYECNE